MGVVLKKIILSLSITLCISVKSGDKPIWFETQATMDDIVAALAKKQVDVNSYNDYGFTGLMFAVDKGNSTLAQALVDAGADIHLKSRDAFGNTALHIAITDMNDANSAERMPIIQFLLEQGARSDAVNNNGEMPLHCLITIDQAQTVFDPLNLLIAYGADCNAQDKKGNSYLHNLVELRATEMIGQLRRHYGFILKEALINKEGYTPLAWAERLRSDEAGLRLKDPAFVYQGVTNVSSYDINGFTPLMVAVMCNDFKEAQRYLDEKGDINKISNNKMGFTALHYALVFKNISMAQWLLSQGASVLLKNSRGYTPAHLFVALGFVGATQPTAHKDVVLSLIQKDPTVLNIQNNDGDSLIHTLVKQRNYALLDTLSKQYAKIIDYTLRNKNLKTSLDIAQQFKDSALVELLNAAIQAQDKERSNS